MPWGTAADPQHGRLVRCVPAGVCAQARPQAPLQLLYRDGGSPPRLTVPPLPGRSRRGGSLRGRESLCGASAQPLSRSGRSFTGREGQVGPGLRGALKTSVWQPLSPGWPGAWGRRSRRALSQGCTGPHRRGGIQSRAHATSVTSFLANGSGFKQLHCLVGACRSHTLPKESLRPAPAPACHPACGVKPRTPKRQLTSPLKGQPEARGHQVEAKQGLSRTLSSEPLLRCPQPSASGLPFPGKAGATFLGGQTRGLAPPSRTSRLPADKVWAA